MSGEDRGVFHVLSPADLDDALESLCEDDRELDEGGNEDSPADTYRPGC